MQMGHVQFGVQSAGDTSSLRVLCNTFARRRCGSRSDRAFAAAAGRHSERALGASKEPSRAARISAYALRYEHKTALEPIVQRTVHVHARVTYKYMYSTCKIYCTCTAHVLHITNLQYITRWRKRSVTGAWGLKPSNFKLYNLLYKSVQVIKN